MSREPVVSTAGIVTFVQTMLVMLAGMGMLTLSDDQISSILAFTAAAVGLAAPLAAAWYVRRRVTPVADPRDAQGAPLVPAREVEERIATRVAAARAEDLRALKLRAAAAQRLRAADAATATVARVCAPGVAGVEPVEPAAPGVEHAPEPGLRAEVRFEVEQAPMKAVPPRRIRGAGSR